jgi:aspartyl-tRNA synthetase
MYRSHLLNELNDKHVGEKVVLSGWVNRRRDHGGLIFIDLRDRHGVTQVVFDPSLNKDAHAVAENFRSEFVIKVSGEVRLRPEGMTNSDLPTGMIEVIIDEAEVLTKSLTPPFEIDVEKDVNEELRLKYRYLDLRRQRLKNNIVLRHDVIKFIRDYMCEEGFLEIETPILIKGTPEGSREYIVPSRLYGGNFYVLPQSPQQLKQLLMVAGMDRYFQIARCFRDEDQRGDRQPEFTQLDIEMSFVEQEDVMDVNERLLYKLIQKFKPGANLLFNEAKRLTYDEAMNKYGSDKPDLRFDLEIQDVCDVFKESEFQVFSGALSSGGVIKAMKVPGSADKFSRKDIDELTEVAKIYKAKGLAYIIKEKDELRSPILKFLGEAEIESLVSTVGLENGDIVFFGADTFDVACTALGQVRLACAKKLELMNDNDYAICWVTDFPMFEYNEEFDCMQACHHPFTSPYIEHIDKLKTAPEEVLSKAYDLVLNGNEIGGGSIRIHDEEVQSSVFDALGISKDDAEYRFGHMLEAFRYGVPPHGGIAWGLDRLVMIFANEPNIREVMAFPKDQKAKDLMLGAPSQMPQESLEELHIQIVEEEV